MNALIKRIFRWLRSYYPEDFRTDFETEIQGVFNEALDEAQLSGRVQFFELIWRELRDLPGAIFWQYHRRYVLALSSSNTLVDESERLETRLKRRSYQQQFFRLLKTALIVLLLIGVVYLHGYLFTVFLLHQSRQEFGIYASFDEAVQSIEEPYGHYFVDIKSVSIASQAPINERYPFIWEVRTNNVLAASLADGSPITSKHRTGKIYYIHTQDGWIPFVRDTWIEVGFLPHWMEVYHLDGEGD